MVKLYFLSYDLCNERDYETLYKELENFKAVRVLESVWCFKRVNTNAERLRNYFNNFIDKDDKLLVTESAEWATYNADGTPKDL